MSKQETVIFEIEFPDEIIEVEGPASWTEAQAISAAKSARQFSDVKGGSSTAQKPASVMDNLKRTIGAEAKELMGYATGVPKAVGETVQTGGQWMEHVFGMPVSPPRTTSTGRDVFAATSPEQQAGKNVGALGLALAGGMGAGPAVSSQIVAGGLTGALANPEHPYAGLAVGAGSPAIVGGISAIKAGSPSVLKDAASKKFDALAKALKNEPIAPTAADDIALQALEMGGRGGKTPGTGSTLTKVFRDYIARREASPEMTYEIGRKFATRAGNLSALEKTTTDRSMDRLLKQFSAALDDATRETAAKKGMGELQDAAMSEWAKAMARQKTAEKLSKALRRSAVPLAVGTTGAGLYNALSN